MTNLKDALNNEREIIAIEARRYASHYPAGSDGRNTFVMLADWIEGRFETLGSAHLVCDDCGARFPPADVQRGALRELVTPSSDRSKETYETLCISCASQPVSVPRATVNIGLDGSVRYPDGAPVKIETTADHIARDMRSGIFPKRSEPLT